MSQATHPTTTATSHADPASGPSAPEREVRRARAAVIFVMIVAITLAGVAREWSQSLRHGAAVRGGSSVEGVGAGRGALGSMDSFALALLLGGLRGPLVMMLWTSSEQQKQAKDLEGFDTKIEWIRLLQPEFDTVHIFQIWNKAYNVSVQMASKANKYATILDAIDYAQSVNHERPDDINIVSAIAQTYFDKLAGSQEKAYYKARVRRETLTHADEAPHRRPGDPGWRRAGLDPMLDDAGHILPACQNALKAIAPFGPFRYGLSPNAIAFAYYVQAQHLLRNGRQHHAQLSDMVVDSRPALSLKVWAEDELERGRLAEIRAFDLNGQRKIDVTDRAQIEEPAEGVAIGAKPADPAALADAIDAFGLCAKLATQSQALYADHLLRYPNGYDTYQSHIAEQQSMSHLARADWAYASLLASDTDASLRGTAIDEYKAAMAGDERILLRYYFDDAITSKVWPAGTTRNTVANIPAGQLPGMLVKAYAILGVLTQNKQYYDVSAEDRGEFERYIRRAAARLALLGQPTPPAVPPAAPTAS